MTKDELSLLLFFECAVVDHGGLLSSAHMNADDMKIAKRWTESGYATLERIHSSFLGKLSGRKTHCVSLSETAFQDAHKERRARADRCWKARTVLTVSEYNQQAA